MKIRETMTPAPATCDSSTPVRLAAQLMSDHHCAAIPVIESGRLVGIITDRDIACRGVAFFADAPHLPVSRLMSRPVITIGPDESVDRAVELMEENAIHHLPVIDGAGKLLGIVAQSDLGRRMTNREFGRMVRSTSIPARGVYLRTSSLVRKEN